MEDRDIVVVAAGEGPDVSARLPDGATVIAADGGADRARTLGLAPDVIVGDLDSVTAAAVAAAERDGALVVRHPAAKDATDLELALEEAVALGPTRILVVSSAGGRLDHLLSSLQVLAADRLAGIEVDALVGTAAVHVIRGRRELHGLPGEPVSLFAVGGPARGVTTDGLEYALAGEALAPSSSRGVSNVFSGATATVTVEQGVLLAVRPDAAVPS